VKKTIAVLALFAAACTTASQPAKHDPLYDEIARVDAEMFAAFNAHDADKVETFFDPGLEFFHDKGGLATREASMAVMRSNFTRNDGLRRDLVPGTLEVYPIRDYGAIEVGQHRFCHVENGKNDCGTFKFLHVWQKQPAGWKITRVVSYGH
jgi:hypothetical protein